MQYILNKLSARILDTDGDSRIIQL